MQKLTICRKVGRAFGISKQKLVITEKSAMHLAYLCSATVNLRAVVPTELDAFGNSMCSQLFRATQQLLQVCSFWTVFCLCGKLDAVQQPNRMQHMQNKPPLSSWQHSAGQICQDIAWEKLHTGDWKNVSMVCNPLPDCSAADTCCSLQMQNSS